MLTTLFKRKTNEEGFTLIELLVVIIIIGVLAAIALPIFLNQQRAAFDANAKSDLRQLQQAIVLAQLKTNKSMLQITGNTCTGCAFGNADPAKSPRTLTGWVLYDRALDRISEASGVNVRGLVDGYGRPYRLDENEGENGSCANKDVLTTYLDPYAGGGSNAELTVRVPFSSVCG